MKYFAVISHAYIVEIKAEDYREAVKKSSDVARELRDRTGVPYTVEQVQKDDGLYSGIRQ
jgi:hypothetical protein